MATNCPRTCYCGFLRRGLRLILGYPLANRTRRTKPRLHFGGCELPFVLDILVFEKGPVRFGRASSWWGWRGGSCVRDVAIFAAFANFSAILFGRGSPAGCGWSVCGVVWASSSSSCCGGVRKSSIEPWLVEVGLMGGLGLLMVWRRVPWKCV